MGQFPSTQSSVVKSKGRRWEADRKLYTTPVYSRPSHQQVFTCTNAKPMPHGLQIPAKNTDNLKKGFPYPKNVLMCYDINKHDWKRFQRALSSQVSEHVSTYAVERLLDLVAQWDVQFFRKKGLVMRMDMPGEEKYGLDFMTIYYKHDLVSSFDPIIKKGNPQGPMNDKALKRHHKALRRRQLHLGRARGCGYYSTRIVLDPIEVLQDKQMSDERGWTAWDQQCKATLHCRTQTASTILWPSPSFSGDERLRPRSLTDRWPPCKHLYYDRYHGYAEHVETEDEILHELSHLDHSLCTWIPAKDSLDQRLGGTLYRTRILPADDMPYVVVDDNSSINFANLMARGSVRKRDGTSMTPWFASLRGQEMPSTCSWPDFPRHQGRGLERLT